MIPSKKVAIIGPIIIDQKSSGGEGEKLYQHLRKEGFEVYKKSGVRNKLLRLLDTLWFMLWNSGKYDVVVVMVFSGKAFLLEYFVFILSKMLRKKTIGVLHGGALNEFYKDFPNMVGRLYNMADHIVTPSHYLQYYFQARGWVVNYIPNFINNDLFPFNWENPQDHSLLWVRAFHDIYKPELAIRCVYDLKARFPRIKLTMVGPDQGKLGYCKQLIEELGVQNHIDIVGLVPNRELNSYYKSHMVFVTTTTYESFGVALVEAASSGIPMVSTKVGEIPYMWHEEEEMLMAEDNNQSIFNQKVEQLLTDQDLRNRLSKNARKKAESFTWNYVKNKWGQAIVS